jgi:phosphatidylglycerophosphate synthase
MRVWIDATSASSGIHVFGMTMLERVLRSLERVSRRDLAAPAQAGALVSEVWVELPPGAPIPQHLPAELAAALSVSWLNEPGTVGARLAKALRQAEGEPLLAVPGDAEIDLRLFDNLLRARGSIAFLGGEGGGRTALLRCEGQIEGVDEAADSLLQVAEGLLASGAAKPFDEGSFEGYIRKLRRVLPPYLFRVLDDESRRRAERFLFWSNYKGSTDFMTKYVYPPLVWWMVRPLARWRVHPNWVTSASILCTFAAIPFFARGQWVTGLVLAYVMSVLDSVDGKLARTTFRFSAVGNVLDHGLDLIHPPLWYMAWAWSLGGGRSDSTIFAVSLLWTAWYVIDRIIAQVFKRRTGRSIHAMAELDVRMRTFISRRNVNLPLFTVALPLGLAVPVFHVLALWQVGSALFHLQRLVKFWNWRRERLRPA